MIDIIKDFLCYFSIFIFGFYIINAFVISEDYDSSSEWFSDLFSDLAICDTVGEFICFLVFDVFLFLHTPVVLIILFFRWFLSLPIHHNGGDKQ